MRSLLPIALYVACELIANVTAGKPVALWGEATAPGGVFIYALTFTLIDLIHEQAGKKGARLVILAAFAANILLAAYTQIILALPAPSFFVESAAFGVVLGSTPRIVAASLAAYLVSSIADVEVFAWWKRRWRGHAWARVLASNAVSTGVDSVLFVTIAFAGRMPLGPLLAGQYAVKMGVTVLSIPLIYLVRSSFARSAAPPR